MRLLACCLKCDREDVPEAKEEWALRQEWCRECEDNYEPPEPDGEAFRGREAAAFEAEQMSAWQRLK